MAALSLRCSDCGAQLKNAEEAKQHNEATGHANFEESTEAVLQLVCKTCGKPCRSETEKQLHMKRNPGHNDFVDQTAVAAGPVDYTIEKDDHMDLDEDTKRAIAAATGKDPDAIAKAAADAAPKEDGPKERVTEKVNKELMTQLIEMGFPDVRAEKGLWLTGNESLENAINWLAEHSEDADIDIPLEIDPASAKVKLSKEEQQRLLEEKLAKMRADKAKKDKELEKQQELGRIQMNKELNEALKKQKEQEEKLALEKAKRDKERDKADRDRIKAKLEQDRLERLAAKGIKPEDAATVAKVEKPADPYKERKLALSSKLRDIIGFHRNDPTTPNPGTKALETANKYVENIFNNPTEEKFQSINLENAAFQRLVGGKKGGLEMMAAIGFADQGGKLVISEIDVDWLKIASGELQVAAKRGPFY